LRVNLKIIQGVANVEDARMEGPAVGLTLTGSASVPARELDLRGTAALLLRAAGANAAIPGFELPFMVQGPWDDPIMLPDPQSRIQRSGAAAPLLDAVRDRGTRDAVRSAIERLTGASPAAGSATPAPAPGHTQEAESDPASGQPASPTHDTR
jgi:AsmA protein